MKYGKHLKIDTKIQIWKSGFKFIEAIQRIKSPTYFIAFSQQ